MAGTVNLQSETIRDNSLSADRNDDLNQDKNKLIFQINFFLILFKFISRKKCQIIFSRKNLISYVS